MDREKLGKKIIFLLLCFLIILYVFGDNFPKIDGSYRNLGRSVEEPEDKRKNVYISASFRSGSSFLGSIFDQNSDFLYARL